MKKNPKKDNNSFKPYKYNKQVESVLLQSQINFLSDKIDKMLENEMTIENQEELKNLVDSYLFLIESVDKRI